MINFIFKGIPLTILLLSTVCFNGYSQVEDAFTPLLPNSIHFHGYLEGYIQNSIQHWDKGIFSIRVFYKLSRRDESFFEYGELW